MANFWLIHLGMIAYIFIKDMNYHCAKCYNNISTNMDTTNIFLFLAIFCIEFYYFAPKLQSLDLFSLAL